MIERIMEIGKAPRKKEMEDAVILMGKQAEKLGVDIRVNSKVTADTIREMKPHSFINAIGAAPLIPDIPGRDLDCVVNSHEVLAGTKAISGNVVASEAVWSVRKRLNSPPQMDVR